MRCVILGAGEGRRLRPHTDDRPKCLVELAGQPLLVRISAALRAAGIDDLQLPQHHHVHISVNIDNKIHVYRSEEPRAHREDIKLRCRHVVRDFFSHRIVAKEQN